MDQPLNPYAPPTASVEQFVAPGNDDYLLASRSARLLAALIDVVFMVLIMIPVFFMIDADDIRPSDPLTTYKFFAIPWLVCFGIQWALVATSGQTIGKKLLGIKITMLDGSPCGFLHGVILRSWITSGLNMIPMIGGLISFIDTVMIFGSEQRCGHDLIAGTRVIDVPAHG